MPSDSDFPAELVRSQQRRDRILEAGTELASAQGLSALSAPAIAAAAGVDESAVDYYFGDRWNLVAEILRELRFRRHERYGAMLANLPAAGSPTADWNASVGDVARGLVWVVGPGTYTFWELLLQAARIPELAAEARVSFEALHESVGQLMVAAGVPRGELLGRPLVALEFGMISQHRIGGAGEQDLIDDLSHALLTIIEGHQALVRGRIDGVPSLVPPVRDGAAPEARTHS